MDMLKNECETVLIMIREHIYLFEPFEDVYLFGSILDPDVFHNDIDLLVIYQEFTQDIYTSVIRIQCELQEVCRKSIDLTALSVAEEKDTAFLKKIEQNFLKIK